MIGTNRYIGSPVERIEDLRFLRGRGQFVGHLKRESMLHAAILRSPGAHRLVAIIDSPWPERARNTDRCATQELQTHIARIEHERMVQEGLSAEIEEEDDPF